MTEPGSGSDIRSMSTTATRDGDDYVINGTKYFISHGDVADFVILFAATGTEASGLGATRLTVAATSVGRARRVLEAVTEWAATRRQFGQPVGRFQGVGFQLADCATQLEAAELLALRAAAKCDRGTMTDADAAMAKLYASEMLGRMTDTAVQIFGGMGLMSPFPAER